MKNVKSYINLTSDYGMEAYKMIEVTNVLQRVEVRFCIRENVSYNGVMIYMI